MPLKKSLQQLKSCSEELPLGLFSLDNQGYITLWDKKLTTLTGYEYQEVKGINLINGDLKNFSTFGYQSRTEFLAKWDELNESSEPVEFDWHIKHKNGRKILLRSNYLGSYQTTGEAREHMFLVNNISTMQGQDIFLNGSFEILGRIHQLSTQYRKQGPSEGLFIKMLDDLLQLSGSEYGFVAEVHYDPDGDPYLFSQAITNIAWNTETLDFYNKRPMVFRNLDTLFGYALKHQILTIANDPANDPRAGGLPQGHPPLNAFLGIPLIGQEGKMVGMIGLANRAGGYTSDITVQMEPMLDLCTDIFDDVYMTKNLEFMKERNRKIFSESSLMHFITKSDKDDLAGIIIEANDAFIDNLLEDSLNVLGHRMLDFFAAESHAEILNIIQRLESSINQSTMTVISPNDIKYSTLAYVLDKKGNKSQVELKISLSENIERIVTGLEVICLDISGQLAAKNYSSQLDSEWLSLISSAKVAIFSATLDGIITEWNQNMELITGVSADNAIGSHFRDFLFPEAIDEFLHRLDLLTSEKEKHHSFEVDIRGKHDRAIKMLISAVAKRDRSGQISGIRALGQDITLFKEQSSAMMQAQKMEAIGTMAGGLAHDLNNILTIVKGNLELVWQELGEDNNLVEMVEDALSSTNDGYDITRRLMAFSRTLPIQIRDIPVNSVISSLLKILGRSIDSTIKLEIVSSESEIIIKSDPNQLETAILNLVLNARDAINQSKRKDGKIVIAIEHQNITGNEQELEYLYPGNYGIISVSDNGIGMTPNVRVQAINPYYTTKPVGTGTGLGLAMVHGFAKQNCGGLAIQSMHNKGTTVKLYLPLSSLQKLNPNEEAIVQKQIQSDKVINSDQRIDIASIKNILIVDDNEKVLRVVARSLHDWGFQVKTAENADQALRLLGMHNDIDLVLSDIVMHGSLSGRDLAKQVAELYPHIKVMLMTGYEPTNKARQLDLNETSSFVLYKPYTKEQFFDTLQELIKCTESHKD